jgi:hypothetical protein
MSGEYLQVKTADGRSFRMLNTVDFTFVIEHATRGLFRGFDEAPVSGKYGPRFMSADRIHRRSPEVWSTRRTDQAMEMIGRVIRDVPDAYLVRMALTKAMMFDRLMAVAKR